jgi:hypothetical protein
MQILCHEAKELKIEAKRKLAARIVFFLGVVLALFGTVLILITLAYGARQRVISAFLLLIIGGLCVFLALKLKRCPLYLFFAAFFTLVILFLLLKVTGISGLTLKQSWPLLAVFAGLALLPAGVQGYGAIRPIYLIPSIALVVLGGFLMLFSLRIINFSFKQFILGWGPVIVVVSGLMLILLSSIGGKERT